MTKTNEKKLTKSEVMDACTFESKTVIEVWDKSQVWSFMKQLPDRETQEKCLEQKTITVKPLNASEVKELAFSLLENGYNGNLFGISDKEKIELIRENKELLADTKESLLTRLDLDATITDIEKRFSPARAKVIYREHPEINV